MYSYDNSYNALYNAYSIGNAINTLVIVSLVIAVIGVVLLMVLFLTKRNETKFSGFPGWLYDFLNFKNLFAEKLLKVIYLISAIFITSFSLGFLFFINTGNDLGTKFIVFLVIIVLGNVLLRVIYEFMMLKLIICKNTSEINKKLSSNGNQNNVANNTSVNSDVINNDNSVQGVVYCPNCGNKHDSNETSCPFCGYKK